MTTLEALFGGWMDMGMGDTSQQWSDQGGNEGRGKKVRGTTFRSLLRIFRGVNYFVNHEAGDRMQEEMEQGRTNDVKVGYVRTWRKR